VSNSGVIWESLRSDSLSGRIVSQVREALFSGQMLAGDFLGSEATLAERFGVSRMAVRDALRNLEASGVVEIRMGAKGGAWIAGANMDRFADALAIQLQLIGVGIEEIFDAQIAIEVMAADLAARIASPEDHLRLSALLEEMVRTRNNAAAFTDVAMQFHQAVIDASHNRVLTAQFKALRFVLQPIYARKTTIEAADRAIETDRKLLGAIMSHDADLARTLIQKRLLHIRSAHLGSVAAAPERVKRKNAQRNLKILK
jgi:GntR family transcriptional regulator, transcriptional repressor for pyruvate dehydrogenase complex